MSDDNHSSQVLYTLGSRLKQTREEKGLTLDATSVHTRIRLIHLRVIEQGLDQVDSFILPSAYYRGYIKTYATFLGVDHQPFIDEINHFFPIKSSNDQQSQTDVYTPVAHEVSVKQTRLIVFLGIFAVLLTALMVIRHQTNVVKTDSVSNTLIEDPAALLQTNVLN